MRQPIIAKFDRRICSIVCDQMVIESEIGDHTVFSEILYFCWCWRCFSYIYRDYVVQKRDRKSNWRKRCFLAHCIFLGVVGDFFSITIYYYVNDKSTIKIKKLVVIIYKMVVARVCYLDPERSVKPPTIFGIIYVTTRGATSFPYRMVTGE